MISQNYIISAFFVFLLILVSCGTAKKTSITEENYQFTENNIKYLDTRIGRGNTPKIGNKVTLKHRISDEKGNLIEDSFAGGFPLVFTIHSINSDKLEIIPGLQEGIMSMKEGGIRKLWITSETGFGSKARRAFSDESVMLIEIELVKVE